MPSFSDKSLYLFTAALSLGLGTAQGQTLFVPNGTVSASGNGNVGIGTAFPDQKLTIQAGHGDTQLRLFSDNYGQGINGVNTALLSLWASEPAWTWGGVGIGNNVTNSGGIARVTNTRGGSYIRLLDSTMYFNVVDSSGGDRNGVSITSLANVGVGTTTPGEKLEVKSGNILLHGGEGGTSTKLIFKTEDNSDLSKFIGTELYWTVIGGHGNEGWRFKDNSGDVVMQINGLGGNNGNVGIGTTNPTHKLAVNGTIKAKEIIVETTGWSDYVFADDYALAPLTEVEAHIKEHKHLPGIPSASQVAEHGISVGDMQARLLAKIEELTLHVISLKKDNDALHRRVESLEHK